MRHDPARVRDHRHRAAGEEQAFGANRLLLLEHRIHLENLSGLGEMPPSGGWVIVGGIRIQGGSGSPATVFGLIP